ncbi:unnamed protein product [Adineta steineri]|uniref:NHL repeat containing protein n=1 Tax=Adineta steineri TaxID=433720 RepID=A0A813YXM2_9BILA|nr:unnamed protein product [Adineta steineri]
MLRLEKYSTLDETSIMDNNSIAVSHSDAVSSNAAESNLFVPLVKKAKNGNTLTTQESTIETGTTNGEPTTNTLLITINKQSATEITTPETLKTTVTTITTATMTSTTISITTATSTITIFLTTSASTSSSSESSTTSEASSETSLETTSEASSETSLETTSEASSETSLETTSEISTTSTTTTSSSTTVCPLSSQSAWSQTAITIFGSQAGTSGSNLTLLSQPVGMYYDGSNNLLTITDLRNQRILQFSLNISSSVATIIAGGNGYGCNMNQFRSPDGIGIDSSGQFYIGDYDCGQLVRFPSNSNSATNGTLLSSSGGVAQVFVNSLTNDVYFVGSVDNAIYMFVGGSGSRVIAAGGNGNGNALNQLSGPNGVYYDYLYTSSLYVTDTGNNRVMKFPSDSTSATYGTVVAGGNGVGSGANQFNNPRSILVDNSGTLYIADASNNRVQRWLQNAASGTTIVGGTQGAASNQLTGPEQILFDKYNNLLVADRHNNRIQLFNITIAC